MKICKLKSLNINSLKGTFEIDFESFLKNESLFAITGPTGSGKSTILDIITCALYGKTPRLPNPNDLMSRHTGESLCEVEFEIKGRRYRSSWSQRRARKKSYGNFQTAKMEVAEVESGKILESKFREVPKYIEELSGLDFDRFVQSMMLAQGSFDAFIKAKESERSNLLEKITGTTIYKQISQEIYESYNRQKKAIELEENALQNIELLEAEVLEQRVKELEVSQQQKQQYDAHESELKKHHSYLDNLQKLESDNKRYQTEFEAIRQEKERNKEQFLRLEQADKALRIQPLYQERYQLKKVLHSNAAKLTTLQKGQEQLQEKLSSSTKTLELLKKQFDQEKIAYENNSIKLKELRVLQTQVNAKSSLLNELAIKRTTHQQTLSTLLGVTVKDDALLTHHYDKEVERLVSLKKEVEEVDKAYQAMDEQSKNLAQKETETKTELNNCETLIRACHEYEKTLNTIEKEKRFSKEFNQAIQTQTLVNDEKFKLITQIQATLQTLKEKREQEILIKNYEADRAKLQEGEACYLCGSKEHPYLSHHIPQLSIDETSSKIKEQESLLVNESAVFNQRQIELTKLNAKLEATVLKIEKLNTMQTSIDEVFTTLHFQLESDSLTTLEEQKELLEKELGAIMVFREKKEQLAHKKNKLQTAYHEQVQRELTLKNTLSQLSTLNQESDEINRQIKTLKNESKAILDIDDIEGFEAGIKSHVESIQNSYNALQKDVASFTSKEEFTSKQIQELLSQIEQEKVTLKALKTKLDKALEEYAFSSLEAFERALLERDEFESLSTQCKTIEEKYSQIETLKTETAKRLKELQALNLTTKTLERVSEELGELQTLIDELQKTIGSLEKELEINATNLKKHTKKIKELEQKRASFQVWVKLNEMIGSSSGDKFAKFAQGITLDQLIYLANQHLKILSPRYELQRSLDTGKLLEIEVIDGFQGDVVRPVSTLSGGESFIVSLALALGLSALASQKIAIDSLFLDEGFGTLDSESLEMALNALNALQSSGKMVGVISHVEALKERIGVQIRVVPRGDGTSLVEIKG